MLHSETASPVARTSPARSLAFARAIVFGTVLVSGCSAVPSAARLQAETPTSGPAIVAIDTEAASRGAPIYARYCETCHGVRGDGRGVSASNMNPRPRNFVSAIYKCRSTANSQLPLPRDLRRTVAAGIHATAMPGWNVLGDAQLYEVVEYVRTFSPRWRSEPVPPPVGIAAETPDDDASRTRGRAIYDRVGCSACHGSGGRGDGPAVPSLRDDSGQPIVPFDFTGNRPLRCGSAPAELYRTLVTGVDGTPMPSFSTTMTPPELWDLVHFVMSLRQ